MCTYCILYSHCVLTVYCNPCVIGCPFKNYKTWSAINLLQLK